MKNNELNKNYVLPHDPEAERFVLGTLMQQQNALNEVRELLTPETFYEHFHQLIYKTILEIDARGDQPDMITVMNEVRNKMGENFPAYEYAQLSGSISFNLYQHARLLHDKEKRRKFYEVGHYLSSNCFSEAVDIDEVLTKGREKLDELMGTSRSHISTFKEALDGLLAHIDRNTNGRGTLTGSPTGFALFDQSSGGLQKSDLIVVAGDTSMGKTSFAISMLMNNNSKVAFYSMEMKKEQIAARIVAMQTGIPANEILFKKMEQKQLDKIHKNYSKIKGKDIYFDDRSTSNLDTILASIRSMKVKFDIDGVVIDYLQILNLNMKESNKEQQMGEAARKLKNLAKELDIWIVALSQLSRDNSNPVPSLNRLRNSGQIAEAADVVFLIYRPEVYGGRFPAKGKYEMFDPTGVALINVAKGRNIGLLDFLCGFDSNTTRFYETHKLQKLPPPPPLSEEAQKGNKKKNNQRAYGYE